MGCVDAVIIARDDYDMHYELARPFLTAGIPVFVDKPLSLKQNEIDFFEPYLKSGLLMSTSAMRYAEELDDLRNQPKQLGELKYIEGVILNGFEKYGIHLLDAVASMPFGNPVSIRKESSIFPHRVTIELDTGILFHLTCLGELLTKTFHLSFYGTLKHLHYDLHNNFVAFRRTLEIFINMVKNKVPPILPKQVSNTMKLLDLQRKLGVGESACLV